MLFDIDKNKYNIHGDEYVKGETYIMVGFKRYDTEKNIIDDGIAFVTKSKLVHVEIIYEENNKLMMMSASQYSNSVRKKPHRLNKNWVYYRLKVKPEFITNMLEFYNKVKNDKYDYIGILGFILFNQDRSDRWFCSEFCSNVFKINGYKFMWCVEPSNTSPGKLGNMLGLDYNISRLELLKSKI